MKYERISFMNMKARAFLILLTSPTATTFYRTAMPATAAASSEVRDVQPLQNMATKVNPVSCALGSRQLLLTRLQKVTLSVSRYLCHVMYSYAVSKQANSRAVLRTHSSPEWQASPTTPPIPKKNISCEELSRGVLTQVL